MSEIPRLLYIAIWANLFDNLLKYKDVYIQFEQI